MSLAWVAEQIKAVMESAPPPIPAQPRFNPKPQGIPQSGSATEAVFAYLDTRRGAWITHKQVIASCQPHSRAAIDWGLIRLRDWGVLDIASDGARNPRYHLYRLHPDAPAVLSHVREKP